MSDNELRARLTDFQALSLTLYGEGRGEPVEGRIAIGCVVRNRVENGRKFGDSFRVVCLARLQFSCWWPQGGSENYRHVMGLARGIVEGFTLPIQGTALALLEECQFLSEGLLGRQLRDRVNGADHYYSPQAMRPAGRVPAWAEGQKPVCRVGAHLFFRLP